MENRIKQPYQPPNCPQCGLQTQSTVPFCERCKFDLRYGTLGRPKRGKCIYCENTDLTDEHIFPDWLGSVYPRRFKRTVHTLTRPDRHVFFEPVTVHPAAEVHNHDPYTTTVRNVCADCNNGWMSDLQNEAKYLVTEFADGKWRQLSESERELLARWAVMVSINLECRARMLTTKEYQRQILKSGSMPPGWRVYLGLHQGVDVAGMSFHGSVGGITEIADGEFSRLQNSFFCIEHAVFQTLSSSGDCLLEIMQYTAVRMQSPSPLSFIWPLTEVMHQEFEARLDNDHIEDLTTYTSR